MKLLAQIVAVAGLMFLTSGCTTGPKTLEGMNGGVCANPKCQCPKPCQCGAGCRCGMNGNAIDMNGAK